MANIPDTMETSKQKFLKAFFCFIKKSLYEKHRPVDIYMDGASYHKQQIENIPIKNEIVDG